MTGFAERLIARGAGRPTGLPLLKPRPAARFEQETSPSAETDPSVEPGREVSRSAGDVSPIVDPPPTGNTANTTPPVSGRSPVHEMAVNTEDTVPARARLQSRHAAESQHAETPSRRTSSPQEVKAAPAPEPSAPQDRPDSQVEFRPRPLFYDEPLVKPAARLAPEAERAPPAPAISIGRIDVQFLPQERPIAPAQPKPQRTRGFDSYARARRGEPR